MADNKKAARLDTGTASKPTFNSFNLTPPIVTGQCADVLGLIRQRQPVMSFVLTADHAILETVAPVHELRAKGFNVLTEIKPDVVFPGVSRRNAALYSIGTPEWPCPGFFESVEMTE